MAEFETDLAAWRDLFDFRGESSKKINESVRSCLDLGIIGAKRGVSGNRRPGRLKTMASTFEPRLWKRASASVPPPRSLGRRMTFHAAAALIAFSVLQIWLVSSAISAGAPSAFVITALVVLLALAIPAARAIERHWYHLSRQALASWGLHARFRRDVRRLWAAALFVPIMWVSGAMAATDAIAAIAN
ncbi:MULTISPECIES: hypothetical protein [Sphingopyxis]|nr:MULTISPECIES: hypothetical protein [Sphingopyxis]